MSIINEAIKKARKEFEVKKDPVIGVSGSQGTVLPKIQAKTPETKWTTLVVVSLIVIVSFLGSLFLYKHISKINEGNKYSPAAGRLEAEAMAPVSRTARNTYAPLDSSGAVILNGIVHGPEDKWAIINDTIVREGDNLASGKVILIEEDLVEILQDNGEKQILKVK